MRRRRPQAVTYRELFGNREFAALFAAQSTSVIGDQFARVAVSVLVFDRTGSAAWTALTYGLTFLPDLVGGPLLSGLADRYPRRGLMVTADVARAGLVASMALPGAPLVVVCVLLVAVQLLGSPATAARAALLPTIVTDRAFRAGQGALRAVNQAAQVIGFAAGGALVAGIGTSGVLLADAVTFAVSAVLIAWRVRSRPAPAAAAAEGLRRSWRRDLIAATVLVWTDRRLRALMAFACLAGFYIAGEALAAPYAAQLGGGAMTVGLLLAAYAVGAAVASVVITRLAPPAQLRFMPALAVGSCLPLVLCLADPDLIVVIALFTASGACSAYNVVASATFSLTVPDKRRGQAYGLAVTALRASQGVGVAMAGLLAEHAAPHVVVGGVGILGVLAALRVAQMWRIAHHPTITEKLDHNP